MTVVVFASGQIAADSMTFAGTTRIGGVRKIARGPGNVLAGGAGETALVNVFLDQVEAGVTGPFRLPDNDEGFEGLLVLNGQPHLVSHRGEVFPIDAGFAAIGSGGVVALGALHMGATPERAVEAAIAWDIQCGGAVQIERLDNGAIRPTGKRRKAA